MGNVAKPTWPHETPLFYLSDNRDDAYTVGDSYQHNLILGATGSGKTSGSGRTLLTSMMRADYGGLLTVVKTTDRAVYEHYARQTGREKDLIVVTLDNDIPFRLNFLEYESRRSGKAVAEVLCQLFHNVLEIFQRGHSGNADPFWRNSCDKLIRYGITVLRAAGLPLSIPNIWRLAVEAPTALDMVDDPAWREKSFLYHALRQADTNPKTATETRDLDQAAVYYLQEHPRMGEITRGSVLATFSGMVGPFLVAPLRDLFQTTTNILPEMCFNGGIFILDIPIMGDSKELGQLAQVVFKMVWMRSMERRDVVANPRPVFLFSDEHQCIYSSHDQLFITTARALHVSVNLITQNISNFYAILPGDKGRAETDSLFGNCGTKFLHMNTDSVTNTWAANLISTSKQWFQGVSTALPPAVRPLLDPLGHLPEPARVSASMNQQETFEVPPKTFHLLRSGSTRHGRIVDAVVFQGGRVWSPTGRPWLTTTFKQEDVV
jgi:hypothetical protein